MKVMHWNFFGNSIGQSGSKRYEDELYNNMKDNINVTRISRTKESFLSYIKEYKINDCDIVHATFQALSPLKIIKHPDKFVLTVHDIIPSSQFSILRKLKHMWYLSEHCIQYADQIIADSEFTKTELIMQLGINSNKINVIPLGINKNYKQYDKIACRKQFKFQDNKKYILVVSSNETWKNMDLVTKIANLLENDYQIIKIGYGDLITHPKILSLGYVAESQIPYLYNACDAFVHTSTYEGFGLPCLEAMACGCPVIALESSSIPEIIGDAGYLIDTQNPQIFINTIKNVIHNKDINDSMVSKGLKQSSHFTWERTAQKTIDVYKKM